MAKRKDYWDEYTNLQRVKHDIIRNYLNGWFPILGSISGKLVYFDTHAGKGRHRDGHLGSPLVALDTFSKHTSRDRILSKCEVSFIFIEKDAECKAALDKEISNLVDKPEKVSINTIAGDCFACLESLVDHFKKPGNRLAPSFFFIDPYGFKVPGKIISELMRFQRVELFINIIWRELDMAMRQPATMENTLDNVFGDTTWKEITQLPDIDERAEATAMHFQNLANAKWSTHIRMLGDNQRTRYFLLHLSNHDRGRDLMKECVWKSCPDGGYLARKGDKINQEILIQPEPNLIPLRKWIASTLAQRPHRWQELAELNRRELWLNKHLNSEIKWLLKHGELSATDYSGRLSAKANPLLSLSK